MIGYWIARRPLRGTGRGCDCEIHYSDDMWRAGGCCSVSPAGNAGAQPDEVLFHEVCHSLRGMQGKANCVPTTGTARGYDNEQEFFAVVITNIYMSSKGSTELRASHASYAPLAAPLNTSAGFLTDANNLRIIRNQSTQEGGLFAQLQTVVTPFNPIREYMMNRERYRA
jgi:hypothetical protein